MRAFGAEEREEEAVWPGRGKLREHLRHVLIALVNPGGGRDLAAEGTERIAKRADEGRGVRVAVVDGRHAPQAQFTVGKVGDRLGLVEVVVGDAEVAGVVVGVGVASEVGREQRRRVGRRDHH